MMFVQLLLWTGASFLFVDWCAEVFASVQAVNHVLWPRHVLEIRQLCTNVCLELVVSYVAVIGENQGCEYCSMHMFSPTSELNAYLAARIFRLLSLVILHFLQLDTVKGYQFNSFSNDVRNYVTWATDVMNHWLWLTSHVYRTEMAYYVLMCC